MIKNLVSALLVAATVILAGCSSPESPEEVARAFWQATLAGEASEAAEYSTLIDEAAFDGFEQVWSGAQVEWGRVVIDDAVARVTTTVSGLQGRDGSVEIMTYLVQKGDTWLVDYYRTGDALKDGPVWGNLVGQLEKLGEDLKSRWASRSDALALELEQLGARLQQRAGQMNDEMSALAEEYGEQLDQHLEALSESVREALKSTPDATPQDRRTLNEAVIRLEAQREQLSETDLKTLAEGTGTAAETQMQLDNLSEAFAAWKAEWRQRLAELKTEMSEFSERLTEV